MPGCNSSFSANTSCALSPRLRPHMQNAFRRLVTIESSLTPLTRQAGLQCPTPHIQRTTRNGNENHYA